MNRGVLQSSPVQQMMAGNPNWWIINNNMRPPLSTSSTLHHHQQQKQFLSPNYLPSSANHLSPYSPFICTPSSPSSFASNWHQEHQDQHQLPAESWSQLLMGGLMGCEDKGNNMGIFQGKKMEDWEEQVLNHHHQHEPQAIDVDNHMKQDNSSSYVYEHATNDHHLQDFQQPKATTTTTNWPPHQMMPITSSPNSSSLTSFSNNSSTNMLEFSTIKGDTTGRHPPPDRSSECNSSGSGGGAVKKARVQGSSTTGGTGQTTFKVRKEKLGDRITALHQLVSPFGKTDTASVLLEAIGYIRFLQSQIEALSLPYLGSGSPNMGHQKSDSFEEPKKDLKSRGLCLVPVSCTVQVGSDNGGDYWTPTIGGGFQQMDRPVAGFLGSSGV